MTSNFTSVLSEIASRKVRFIIGKAVQGKDYQDLLAEEEYSFLRTKAMFQRCMDISLPPGRMDDQVSLKQHNQAGRHAAL